MPLSSSVRRPGDIWQSSTTSVRTCHSRISEILRGPDWFNPEAGPRHAGHHWRAAPRRRVEVAEALASVHDTGSGRACKPIGRVCNHGARIAQLRSCSETTSRASDELPKDSSCSRRPRDTARHLHCSDHRDNSHRSLRHCHVGDDISLVDAKEESLAVSRSSVSAGGDQPGGALVLPVSAEPARHRGTAVRARGGGQLRDDPAMVRQIRCELCAPRQGVRCKPGLTWHLDEMLVKLRGEPYLLWRAIDQHGA